jgi:hypothetical protein
MQEIPRKLLPKVFQDAIEVVRQARIRYLWIDSLCIIQNCAVDWESESKKMGDIYSNALFNIAATGFEDGCSGLFVERDPHLIEPMQISANPDLPLRRMAIDSGDYVLVDRRAWAHGVEFAPLHRRAWVTQERFLARRVLHFGASQLFWECSERQMCESIPHGINESFMGVVSVKASAYSQLSKGWPVHEYMTYWMRAVESYSNGSNGHLTLISDKMIAISGLARKLQAASEGSLGMYLAGLWRGNLVLQLTWYVKQLGKKSKPSSYRCPSWAWLSTDSAVGFLGPRTDHGIDVAASISECITLFPSGNEYGLLRGGHLRITCQLFCVELVDYQGNDTAEEDDIWWLCPGGRVNVLLDFLTDARDGVGALTASTLAGTGQETIWWRLARPLDTQNNQPELFYLAVIKQMRDSLQGLVLRPATSSDGTFQRFGAFIWNTSGKDQQLNVDELKTVTQDLPIPLCGTRKSDGRYEITIV